MLLAAKAYAFISEYVLISLAPPFISASANTFEAMGATRLRPSQTVEIVNVPAGLGTREDKLRVLGKQNIRRGLHI